MLGAHNTAMCAQENVKIQTVRTEAAGIPSYHVIASNLTCAQAQSSKKLHVRDSMCGMRYEGQVCAASRHNKGIIYCQMEECRTIQNLKKALLVRATGITPGISCAHDGTDRDCSPRYSDF